MAVPNNANPERLDNARGSMPLTPSERAKRSLRNQALLIAALLIAFLAVLSAIFVMYVLPFAKPVRDDSLLIEASYMKGQRIGEELNASLAQAEDTSGNRVDPALSKASIGRWDPFYGLKPDPPPPEPTWPQIRYSGFIKANNKVYAIIEVDQATYSARPGDVLLKDITVTKVNEEELTLSYLGYQKQFVLGGESN